METDDGVKTESSWESLSFDLWFYKQFYILLADRTEDRSTYKITFISVL